ncbi:hypothetical protein PO909_022092 [Leuciscus waleckii]
MSEDIKKFTPFDKGMKLVSKPSDLDNESSVLRAELSCGHVTSPESLTDCCRAQLNDGKTEFKCPLCAKKWPYDEVRKVAKLTPAEQSAFEDKLGTNTVNETCPGCGIFTERSDVSNLCVECSVCTANNRKPFKFCWQCVREWRGPQPRADRCGNGGCKRRNQELLRDCPIITLSSVVYKGSSDHVQCPAIRACIFCGVLIEHTNEGCKMVSCSKCKNEFCFVCLKSARECLKTSTHFISCSAGLAPRQIDSAM